MISNKRKQRRAKHKTQKHTTIYKDNIKQNSTPNTEKTKLTNSGFYGFMELLYRKHHKKLLIIPLILFILSSFIILNQYYTTGDFVEKGVSLKGGTILTIQPGDTFLLDSINIADLESQVRDDFPDVDLTIREITFGGKRVGIAIDTDLEISQFQDLLNSVQQTTGELSQDDYIVESIGSSLGSSFFKEIMRALIVAFISMAIVVFLYFRIPAPSFYVILSAFADIFITLAVVDLFGIKLSTAGIAAFLMLVGYSVDTDILLTIRVLKGTKGDNIDRIIDAMKTGLTMSATTLAAVSLAYFFANSATIKQIMLILIIGLIVDLISTWIQNAPLLQIYLNKKEK